MLKNIVVGSAAFLLSATLCDAGQPKSLAECLAQASQLQDAARITEAKATCREVFFRKTGEGVPTGTLFYKATDLGICLEMGFDDGMLRDKSQPGFCGPNSRFQRGSSGQLLFTCFSGGENDVFRAERRPEGIRLAGDDFDAVLYWTMRDCESQITEADREIYNKRILEQQKLAARDAELAKQAGGIPQERAQANGKEQTQAIAQRCCECLRAARSSIYGGVQCLSVSVDDCIPSVLAGHDSMIRIPSPSCRDQCSRICPGSWRKILGLGGRRPSPDD